MNKIKDIKIINLDIIKDLRGNLLPIEFQKQFNISIKRSFLIFGKKNTTRGNHAHIKCTQFMCCISGSCKVKLDDGDKSELQLLNDPTKILKIPNMIWSSQIYNCSDTILLVFCDQDFSEEDYIRDYGDFINVRKEHNK